MCGLTGRSLWPPSAPGALRSPGAASLSPGANHSALSARSPPLPANQSPPGAGGILPSTNRIPASHPSARIPAAQIPTNQIPASQPGSQIPTNQIPPTGFASKQPGASQPITAPAHVGAPPQFCPQPVSAHRSTRDPAPFRPQPISALYSPRGPAPLPPVAPPMAAPSRAVPCRAVPPRGALCRSPAVAPGGRRGGLGALPALCWRGGSSEGFHLRFSLQPLPKGRFHAGKALRASVSRTARHCFGAVIFFRNCWCSRGNYTSCWKSAELTSCARHLRHESVSFGKKENAPIPLWCGLVFFLAG